MLVDFLILKTYVKTILETLDYQYIDGVLFFREKAGSSEYLSIHIYNEFKKLIKEKELMLKKVRVWGPEKAYAAYNE